MELIYIGDASYKDLTRPVVGKTDWGVDTLVRSLAGRRDQFQTFIATLAQGQAAPDPYAAFKLQNWEPDDSDPIWGRVRLNYKGLVGGTLPDDKAYNEIIETSGSSSHHWDPPYDYGGDFFAVSAVMDFTYYAGQTTWRYITSSSPSGTSHSSLGFGFITSLKKVRYTVSNEDGSTTTFGGMAPAGIVSACTPVLVIGGIGFRCSPILGTGFFECEDIVRAELLDPS